MKTSTMFLRDITCLDHAFIEKDGSIVGGSYHVDVEVEGIIDEAEQVVVDFSSIKKTLKALIDDKVFGYDHKLWVIPGYSDYTLKLNEVSEIVETPAMTLGHSIYSVREFKNAFSGSLKETIEKELQVHLFNNLRHSVGEFIHSVRVKINEEATGRHPNHVPFRYVHGLKNSSSFGCQSLSHGHLSFVEWTHTDQFKPDCFSCQSGVQHLMQAISYLDNAILVKRENIRAWEGNLLTIGYESERGEFWAEYNTERCKVVVMDCETTIENITNWFAEHFKGALEMAHVDSLFISEGLSKGATIRLGY